MGLGSKVTTVGKKNQASRTGGCFYDGSKLVFNPRLDTGVPVNTDAKQYLVCDNCGHAPAPAPRKVATTLPTRAPETSPTRAKIKSPAPSVRGGEETTAYIRGPKPFQIREECTTSDAKTCKQCSDAGLCMITSKAKCGEAAEFLQLKKTTPQTVKQQKTLGGCYFTDDEVLIFNERSDGNKSPVGAGDRPVCALCPTTVPPKRTTVQVKRTEPPKTDPPTRTGDDDTVQSERTSSSSRGGSHFFEKLGQVRVVSADHIWDVPFAFAVSHAHALKHTCLQNALSGFLPGARRGRRSLLFFPNFRLRSQMQSRQWLLWLCQ